MANFSTLTRRLFITLNIVTLVLFLLACTNVFLHPGKWWMISLLGLIFPFLLLAVFCFFVVGLCGLPIAAGRSSHWWSC